MRRAIPFLVVLFLALFEVGVIGFFPFPWNLVSPVVIVLVYFARRLGRPVPLLEAILAGVLFEPVSDFPAGTYLLIFIVIVIAVRLFSEYVLTNRSVISLGLLIFIGSLIYFILLAGGRWLAWLSRGGEFLELDAEPVFKALIFGVLLNTAAVVAAEAGRRIIYRIFPSYGKVV